ncbi:hypothetical protein M3J09_002727 [Ascochyta lentis]
MVYRSSSCDLGYRRLQWDRTLLLVFHFCPQASVLGLENLGDATCLLRVLVHQLLPKHRICSGHCSRAVTRTLHVACGAQGNVSTAIGACRQHNLGGF